MPRSLVTALAYVTRGQIRSGRLHKIWERIRVTKGKDQREAAEELVMKVKVKIPREGCSLNEIEKFQLYLSLNGIAIVVYFYNTFAKGGQPLYDGTDFVLNKMRDNEHNRALRTLRIMFYERKNHFEPILNLTGAAGSRGVLYTM